MIPEAVAGVLLSQRSARAAALRDQHSPNLRRRHDLAHSCVVDPVMACLIDLQPLGAEGGERFSRFMFAQGDLAIGNRFHAKPTSLQHVLRSEGDFLLGVSRNSMRIVTADGARLSALA